MTVFWFRRDLRLDENHGFYRALSQTKDVLPVFIFDPDILDKLVNKKDLRVQFIHQTIAAMRDDLISSGSEIRVFYGKPLEVFKRLKKDFNFKSIYLNHDYEPDARQRDDQVRAWAASVGVEVCSFKDQVIFEKSEILNLSKKPYTVFTPYKKRWLETLKKKDLEGFNTQPLRGHLLKQKPSRMVSLKEMGFEASDFKYPAPVVSSKLLSRYKDDRDFPYLEHGTSRLGLHLRFGTVSVRALVEQAQKVSDVWLSELIWREFFMQILWHFPVVVGRSFRPEYERVKWRTDENDFAAWCEGRTGYPLVDAGMRQLNETGFMHNRVRMITASFLTKHLLMYWLKGERYFAEKLLDYELSANNGNWQWAAGTGCDAAPYFRVFNPETQLKKFDGDLKYVKTWIPEFGTKAYPTPMVDHKDARERCLRAFQIALKGKDPHPRI